VAGTVTARNPTSNKPAGSTRIDPLGRYWLAVPAGRYTVSVTPDGAGARCSARDVTVTGSTVVQADFDCTPA
jgi:hypothetical protein